MAWICPINATVWSFSVDKCGLTHGLPLRNSSKPFYGDLSRNNTDSTNETKGMIGWLVVYLPLWKNRKVSWDDYSQCMEKCSKPPTSWGIGICFTVGDNTGMWWAIFEQLKTMRIYWRCTMGIYRIWVFIIGYHGMYSQELLSGKRLQYANLKMAQSK